MPSHLRLQSSFEEPISAQAIYNTLPSSPSPRPAKKARMSLTQTYYVASTARSKLGKEAGRADHNLRLLVGHANLLDQLMVDLADAERESENWLNQSIREASRPEEPRHVQWMDSIVEDYEEEEDDESDDGEEDIDHADLFTTLPKIKSAPVFVSSAEEDYDMDEDEDEEAAELALRRVTSRHSPPGLTLDDSDSESEEEDDDEAVYGPKSPKDAVMQLSEKDREAIATTALLDIKSQRGMEEDLVLRRSRQQPVIAAC